MTDALYHSDRPTESQIHKEISANLHNMWEIKTRNCHLTEHILNSKQTDFCIFLYVLKDMLKTNSQLSEEKSHIRYTTPYYKQKKLAKAYGDLKKKQERWSSSFKPKGSAVFSSWIQKLLVVHLLHHHPWGRL